ncbi:hypothetical protein GLOIN_2v1766005 [Rhizophagus irregularis DAOM 181602=DAOM 197198]|uniref:Kelch-like protein 17 n=2 Tax=Rhizophagus irregularis TaxID=588596 RepID=A0A015LRY0_RHIIW|nr:hypothetical protein RirG_041840 [Rhizophagus irregularis DAOM 197198w]GBC21498.1 hypothetical protein GLOIN_2v1766005 [Rhizophagus irregularis DAOM 181602=DAOM 197198]
MQQQLYLPVINSLENLFKSKKDYDVIIQAGEDNDQKEIFAHSNILRYQSDYFDTAFSDNRVKRKDGKYFFEKPNISPYIFEIIIRHLYCGQLNLNVMNGPDILKLLVATEELGLDRVLSEYIQEFLIEDQNKFSQDDCIELLKIVFQHGTFTILEDYCLKTICQVPAILFGTDKILSLPAQILELLLKRDDLALDEIELWNNLVRWAHAQQPTVNKDPSKWTKDELILMEKMLLNFIPLIRFHNISSEEYYNKILPYDDLLPKKLRNEILKSYLVTNVEQIGLLPSRFSFDVNVNSVLINATHLSLFTGWIDKDDEALQIIPYKFNLIFRASRDGYKASVFHEKCNNEGSIIILGKIRGTNQIVGGYKPFYWEGPGVYKYTRDSFVFFFNDYRYIDTGKIGKLIDEDLTLICNGRWMPIFGKDLAMQLNGYKWTSSPYAYPNLNIPNNFEIDDYEVFQVIKNN